MAKHTATRVAFGDVVRLSKERTSDPDADGFDRYVGLEHVRPNDLAVESWGDVADGTSFSSVFRAGHTLFVKRRAYQRKVGTPAFDGVCSSDIYVLGPATDAIIPAYIAFVCQSDRFIAHAVETSAGSLSPRTTWRSLASFEFVLPSVQRQQELVAVGTAADRLARAYREAGERAIAVAKAFREDEIGGAANRHCAPLRPLRELIVLDRSPIEVRQDRIYREIGVRSFGRGVFHKEATTGARLGSKRVFAVESDRLILNIVFAWEGAVALTTADDAGLLASHRFPMYRSSTDDLELRFLYHYLLSQEGVRKLGQASPGGAGRNKTLGQERFLNLTVPVPRVSVQRELTATLDLLSRGSDELATRAEVARHLRQKVVNRVGDQPEHR